MEAASVSGQAVIVLFYYGHDWHVYCPKKVPSHKTGDGRTY